MSEPPAASPAASRLRQPRWLDPRLVLGVLLILVSVLVGAKVVAGAGRSHSVWALKRTLRMGMRLERGDLKAVRVRLFDNAGSYIDADKGPSPAGRVLARDVGADELLALGAVLDPRSEPPLRLVTVPVAKQHALAGDLERGDLVDIIATFGTKASSVTRALLRAVPVVTVVRAGSGFGATGTDLSVIVAVRPKQAVALVAAIESGAIDIIKVVPGAGGPGDIGTEPVVPLTPSPSP